MKFLRIQKASSSIQRTSCPLFPCSSIVQTQRQPEGSRLQADTENEDSNQSPEWGWFGHSFASTSIDSPNQQVSEPIQRLRRQNRQAESQTAHPRRNQTNKTGLPANLKAGIESLSGISMNDVNVHYHSPKPAQLNALAYAQGSDIHVAPGQEEHLPHEAWHVVQQRQGRVRPSYALAEIAVNNEQPLEQEADNMGQRARRVVHGQGTGPLNGPNRMRSKPTTPAQPSGSPVLQAFGWGWLKWLNPFRYLPTWLGGYPAQQSAPRDANERLLRARKRSEGRKERGDFSTGVFDTQTGPVTVSGGPGGRQRMIQGNKANYEGETFGSYPEYEDVRRALPAAALPLLVDPRASAPPMNPRQRLATSLGTGLVNVAEDYRSSGSGKFTRPLVRAHIAKPDTYPHPFDPSFNPGAGPSGPERLRKVVSGETPLTAPQREAIDHYASESSESESLPYPFQRGLMKRRDKDDKEKKDQ